MRSGVVSAFGEREGLGEITDASGRIWPFHCVEILDGSRTIAVGATVAFEPLAKLAPSEEALYRIRVRGRREGDQRVQVQLTSDEQPAPITKEETTRVYADR